MSHRTCTIDGCDRKHQAKGLCSTHYAYQHRDRHGRKDQTYSHACEICGASWSSFSRRARFCSPKCAGVNYSTTQRRRCILPDDHPVMLLIASEKGRAKREPKSRFSWVRFPECVMCGRLFCTPYTVSTCSDSCKKAKVTADRGNAKHKRRALRRAAYLEPVHWRLLFRDAGPACHLCGFDTNPDDYTMATGADGRQVFLAGLEYPTLDHVIPLSRGGDHSRANTLLAHMYCNAIKGAQSLESVA